jgi:imidazole glycerol-phosphate synthase subunit HisH
MTSILIVDHGLGNVGAMANMVRKAGADPVISGDPKIVAAASKLVLPGVGHFGRAMEGLRATGLLDALNEAVIGRKAPILGVCLGMQLFAGYSEEGETEGLGWLRARVIRLKVPDGARLKIPHMGWNRIETARPDPLLANLPDQRRFYFVHSYHVACEDESDVVAVTRHGVPFTSVVGRANIWGTQFHPEKSHKFGLALIRNFVRGDGLC